MTRSVSPSSSMSWASNECNVPADEKLNKAFPPPERWISTKNRRFSPIEPEPTRIAPVRLALVVEIGNRQAGSEPGAKIQSHSGSVNSALRTKRGRREANQRGDSYGPVKRTPLPCRAKRWD